MSDGPTLVFVEVRFRQDPRFGSGLETVTHAKQRKLIMAASAYLARHGPTDAPCRFDVVSVTKRHYGTVVDWVRHAFDQDG
jgi:putative endonuclease